MKDVTLYWHDYETFGTTPAVDRPVQFAGLRTDLDLNIIGEPLTLYCAPSIDRLPQPMACLVTGITPQIAQEKGVTEREFAERIYQEFSKPGTCGVGYNSIRFDDEVTRFLLYRNFYDPYEREWKNGNSRWDIIDMVRLVYALRPDTLEWHYYEDGAPSFRLEDLSKANNILHDNAHDALSDVYATIGLAKLIKEKQPKLYNYIFNLRAKHEVGKLLDWQQGKPVLHVSSFYSVENGKLAVVLPLAQHPSQPNAIFVYDLSVPPQRFVDLDVEEIRYRLFTAKDEFPEDLERLPIKTVYINRCPALATVNLLDDRTAQRLNISLSDCELHWQQLKMMEGFANKIRQAYQQPDRVGPTDPELQLYTGGFFSSEDKSSIEQIRSSSGEELAQTNYSFQDDRLTELLFRYRARNFPDSLTQEEVLHWQEYCQQCWQQPVENALSLQGLNEEIKSLLADPELTDSKKGILNELLNWVSGDAFVVN